MKITVPVSVGELIDKITILQIKSIFTNNEYVIKELKELEVIKNNLTEDVSDYETQLIKVNYELWKIETLIREKEKLKEFDEEFIELARSVYKTNDERGLIKRKINEITNSEYREIKIY